MAGSIVRLLNDGSDKQQRLTRRRGVNPTTIASAATIDTNAAAAWSNYDTHVITGSTTSRRHPAIVTIGRPSSTAVMK